MHSIFRVKVFLILKIHEVMSLYKCSLAAKQGPGKKFARGCLQ